MDRTAGIVELFFSVFPLILFFATFDAKEKTLPLIYQRHIHVSALILLLTDAALRLLPASCTLLYRILFIADQLPVLFCFFFFYAFLLSGPELKHEKKRPRLIAVGGWLIARTGFRILSGITGLCYTYTENASIVKENLFFLTWLFPLTAAGFAVGTLIRLREKIGKRRVLYDLLYLAIPVCLFPLELTVGLPFMRCGIVVALVVIHIVVNFHNRVRLAENQLQLSKSQAKIMISQIQPHFLYNALATIGYLCKKEPKTASDAIDAFAEYLRTNLSAISDDREVPFRDELEHTNTYLWLEKLRFEERLNVIYDINAEDFSLPPLSIQPLVENAVKHGICEKPNGGTVTIRSAEFADRYVVVIEDNGVGFSTEHPKDDGRLHVGIDNVRRRLQTMSQATLEITSTVGRGTVATVSIPKKRTESDEGGTYEIHRS